MTASLPIALLTPMANPTVEREMRKLLPASCDYLVGRLVGAQGDSAARLRYYAERLDNALAQFGGMEITAVAFACTASSYLIGRGAEDSIAEELRHPVLWAARCIAARLSAMGATKIAVISPYPQAIHDAGLEYWRASGFEIVHDNRLDTGSSDTRAIYGLSTDTAVEFIAEAKQAQVDAILLSGTGMPTLDLIEPEAETPVISSNYCLAHAMIALEASPPTE